MSLSRKRRRTALPKEPVPPVINKILSLNPTTGEIVTKELIRTITNVYNPPTLAQITTMGVVTDIKAPVSGKLADILVSDQANVDYAKPLFVIEIADSE